MMIIPHACNKCGRRKDQLQLCQCRLADRYIFGIMSIRTTYPVEISVRCNDESVQPLPSMIHLSIGANGDDAEPKQSVPLVDILQGAYATWIQQKTSENYLRTWPTESPWTEAGAQKRVHIRISDRCPFAIIHFYRVIAHPEVRDRVVRSLIEGCTNMSQLAKKVATMLNHNTLSCSESIIQIRGHRECTESPHVHFIYKTDAVCITTSVDKKDEISRIMSTGQFFLYPQTLKACNFTQQIKYGKVLDLFWGYTNYSEDHGDEFDSSKHSFQYVSHFMEADTSHDKDLKTMIYNRTANATLYDIADSAMRSLAEMAKASPDFVQAQGSDEQVFMIDTGASSASYTCDSFFGDKTTYTREMRKFDVSLVEKEKDKEGGY